MTDEDVAKARWKLGERVKWLESQWITTERLGGVRARRKHEQQQQEELLARKMKAEELRRMAELPDEDLMWLLEQGWSA